MEENGPCQGQGERHRLRAGQGKGGKRQESGWQEHQVFVLRMYIVGKMGVKKLHTD